MDWRYNQTWVMAPLVVGTFIETVEVIGVPVPVDPFMTRPPAPPTVIVEESRYQFATQGVVPHPAAPHPGVMPQPGDKPHRAEPQFGAARPAAAPEAGKPAKAGIVEEYMELNTWNAAQLATKVSDILTGCSTNQWHQIIVRPPIPENERSQVMSAINKSISPLKIIPYFFSMESLPYKFGGKFISFFVNSSLALKALCERNLEVPYASDKGYKIGLVLRLCNKNFNLQDALKQIVLRRLDSEKKFLDLSYINDIPEIQVLLYDPDDNLHILDHMLWIARGAVSGLTALSLAGNGITLTMLFNFAFFLQHSRWYSLRTLDLSDNKISGTTAVSIAPTLHISEVYLHRNPICQMLDKESYIRELMVSFPYLTKLDGTYLSFAAGLPSWKPNFIVESTSDAGELADQFVEHFFTLYDDFDRMKLRGLYHENACFSLSCMALDIQLAFVEKRLSAYQDAVRNLLLFSDVKKRRAGLTHGSEKILERLWYLPHTQHDPYTFTVDLTVHTPKMTVLTVTGIFCEIPREENSHKHFSRTFVLTERGNGEYQITNDILFISNASEREAGGAFQFGRPPTEIKKNQRSSSLSECEKGSMIKTFQELTNRSAECSRKCLEDTDWDLKKSLKIVVLESKIGIQHSK